MPIDIHNKSKEQSVSWFVFNKQDAVKTVALASGDLGPDKSAENSPPSNTDDEYTVRITVLGGGRVLKAESCGPNGTILFP